jgi:uncharacterized OB-fold protein
MADYQKPLPIPHGESQLYWDKAKEHELWLRRCKACEKAYFYPRDISPCCFSKDTEWIQASGKATLHTFTIVHRSPYPGFQADAPFVTAIVELGEGPMMATNIVGFSGEPEPDDLAIGMALKVVFDDVTDEVTLPKFKPA